MTSDSSKQYIPRVAETINFPREEESILTLWKEIDAFRNCLKQSKGKPRYTFYDGPPFATGLPHYGHILAGSIKDVVTRYAHQQGFHVERRFGWDCHGLPVEFEIDKLLGIKGPDDVMKMGIGKYNEHCRKIVMRYSDEWETIMGRLGRWIDFKNDYKSMYPWYMETIWWIFKQLYDKGFVYQGNKVMPYSTACNTPLSNFESGQNYKDVVDPAVTISLPLLDDAEGASLLIWTTTPWTLPSNLAACVNPNLTYVRVKEISTGKLYVLLENRVETVLEQGNYEIVKQFPGRDLRNLRYEPIFPYFKSLGESHGAFRVLLDDYVTAESGTGVVHQAPYFGEDDYRVCLANGIITKDMDPICPVDASGRFVAPVHHFEGQYVKDADKNIMALLKTNNRLVIQSQVKHSYPFCWRSDTPLIYRAVPSWFIRVEHMQDQLQAVSSKTYWVPEFVRDKRFGNWLKEARDWAVSRNRYWGTPIPIWMSEKGDEIRCIGSLEELCSLTGQTVTDIHRENIDHLEIPSRIPGNPPLRRVSEVFDCWFESGSMPYAQQHYPFENKKEFEDLFPADFIAEGIDQTRGWFYTLIVISTALFGEAPFKNLIANGMVLASDGQKMSKRKKNYPDPMEVVNKYGADALRLYLISSPVVRAENLRFKEEGVRDIIKDVFLPWYNAFRFLLQNIENYVEADNSFYYKEADVSSTNVMDLWILSFTQSLLQYVLEEMAAYHLYNVVPRLTKFVDYLTNWYVRMNRKRLKGEGGKEDCKAALLTLFNVVLNITKMMAPFAPFLSETMYQHLKGLTDSPSDSIHFLMFPKPKTDLINMNIERAVSRMQSIIDLGRVLRDRKTIPIKYPLPEVIIIHQDPEYLSDIMSLKGYILSELNVRNISTTRDKSKFGIKLRAEPDQKVLGLRLKNESKTVIAAIKVLTDEEINEMVKSGHRDIAGQRIDISEVRLILKCDSVSTSQYEVNSDNDVLILLDVTPDNSMQDEGVAREIINRVQKLRKKAHLVPTDEISVFYKTENDFARVAIEYTNFIEGTIKASFKPITDRKTTDQLIIEEIITMKNGNLYLVLTKYCNVETPTVKWVNVLLLGFKSRFYESDKGLILLEAAKKALKLNELEAQVTSLFGVDRFALWGKNGKLTINEHLSDLSGTTIVVCRPDVQPIIPENSAPFCKVSNFDEKGTKGTLVLENPKGNKVLGESDYAAVINFWTKGHE